MKRTVLGAASLLAGALIYNWVGSSPATYYVGKSGNDANPCATAQSPIAANRKLTIFGASGLASCMVAGDVGIVGDGTYAEGDYSVALALASTSWGAATTIRAETMPSTTTGTHTAIIKPTSSHRNALLISFTTRKYIQFLGIKFDCTDADGGGERECIKFDGNTTPGTGFANHIRFDYVEVTGSGVSAIGIYSDGGAVDAEEGGDHEFLHMWVHHNGSSYFNNAFYVQQSRILVQDSVIEDNGSSAFTVSPQNSSNPVDNVIERTIMRRNGTNATFHFGACVEIVGGGNRRTIARNNLCYDNQASQGAFDLHESGPGANELYNNTIYNNTGDGIVLTGTANLAKNNIVYGNGGAAIVNSGSGTVLTTNLTTDPSFTNAAGGDFTLQAGSSARDAGSDLTSVGVTQDFLGTARPQNGSFDIGAYEYIVADTTHPAFSNMRGIPGMRLDGRKNGW